MNAPHPDFPSQGSKSRSFLYILGFLGVALVATAVFYMNGPDGAGGEGEIEIDPFVTERGAPTDSFAFSRNNALWVSASTGNDATGTGSESAPFKTIQFGLDAMVDGQALAIRPGIYREAVDMPTVGTASKGLLVTGMGVDKTIIDITGTGEVHAFEFKNGASHITLQNLSIKGAADTGRWSHGVYVSRKGVNRHVTLKNLDIQWQGQKDEGSCIFILTQADANLHVQNVTASGASDGIYLKGSNVIRVEDCTFHGNIEDGIDYNGGSQIFLLNNECYDNGDRGIVVHGNELPQSGGVLRGNHLHGNKDGIAFYLATGTRVVDNDIEGNSEYGLRIAAQDLTIERNRLTSNVKGNINENPQSLNITYQDNILVD